MKMKKRNKLHLLAFMLVAALMMTVATPTVSARADDETAFANPDLIDDEPHEIGGCAGAAPQGYKGGKIYHNIPASADAQKLPEGVTYKEYDINPYVKGQNRGGERLVIGADASLWYTNDHYCSFAKLR